MSFSSRIPNAIPIGDASTMSSNVSIFNSKHLLNINELLKEDLLEEEREMKEEDAGEEEDEETNEEMRRVDVKGKLVSITKKYDVSPIVSMISKHENGTLNLWDVTFSPETKFCQLLNISHKARVNGHRDVNLASNGTFIKFSMILFGVKCFSRLRIYSIVQYSTEQKHYSKLKER